MHEMCTTCITLRFRAKMNRNVCVLHAFKGTQTTKAPWVFFFTVVSRTQLNDSSAAQHRTTMAAVIEDDGNGISDVITLSSRQRDLLSQILQDIRTTVHHLALPKVNPLSATDATAVDALKDLYYMLNVEDRLNALPARQHVFASKTVQTLLHPIIAALHSHPTAQQNQKRWSVPTYQALRTLCVLSSPIPDANQLLPRGCALDSYHSELRAFLAQNPGTLDAMVSLLQYYLERKAAKIEDLSSAESCKLEDARIDNILTFFRNILAPPRAKPGDSIMLTDAGVHLALVAALHKSDFYATLSILFDNTEDMAAHTISTVFLTADIFAYTYRHSTPKSMFHTLRTYPYLNQSQSTAAAATNGEYSDARRIPPMKTISKAQSTHLREAILKERAALGGSRAVTAGARWTNRHSGGFTYHKASEDPSRTAELAFPRKLNAKRIISAKAFVQSKLSFNPKRPFQEAVLVNSQFLCLSTAKRRFLLAKDTATKAVVRIRKDLRDDGLKALVQVTIDFIQSSFANFVREMRGRIAETKDQTKRENPEILTRAQRSYLSVIGAVVGFQRERFGKVRKEAFEENRSLCADIHQNHMKAVLSADFKILKKEWKAVEAAIEVDTFKLAFRVLVESFEALKNTGKDEVNIGSIEVATFAVLEMMKMLQGMAAHVPPTEDEVLDQESEPGILTPRELALNTLEDLFSEEVFLNTPANLAKDFNAKLFSFKHLTNIVELGYSFTTILMDEQELHRLQVNKRKRHRKKKETQKLASGENPDEEEENQSKDKDAQPVLESHDDSEQGSSIKQKPRKVKRITENGDDDASGDEVEAPHPSSPDHDLGAKSGTEGLSGGRPLSEKDANTSEHPNTMSEEPEPGKALPKSPKPDVKSDLTEAVDPTPDSNSAQTTVNANTDAEPVESRSGEPLDDDKPLSNNDTAPKGIASIGGQDEANNDLGKARCEQNDNESPENVTDHMRNEQDAPGNLRQMMMEEADDEILDNEERNKARTAQEMLRADVEAEEKAKAKEKTEKTKRMLLADVENEGKQIQPKLVSTIEEVFPEGLGSGTAGEPEVRVDGNDGSERDGTESSADELEVREMESMGIIRRFAHIKAIHSLILPIRAAICNTTSLTGESYPIPDGAKPLLSPVVVAKSAHLVTSIWKVAKLRERGSLCGQFFTYGVMQLVDIMLTAPQHGTVKHFSVMEQLGAFARDVTQKFFEWLAINPGLTLDMVFGMDKGSCQMYTSFIRQKAVQEKRKNKEEDSGNDSDISQLAIASRVHNDLGDLGRTTRRNRRNPGSRRKRGVERRQRVERPKLDEDEDVDDLDNLKIGIMESEDEGKDGIHEDKATRRPNPAENLLDISDTDSSQGSAPKKVKRVRRRKRKTPENLEPFISDDEDVVASSRMRGKGKKGSKKRLKKMVKKERTTERKQFSSSDEYNSSENKLEFSD